MLQTPSPTNYSQKKIESKILKLLILLSVAAVWISMLFFLDRFFLIKKILVLGDLDSKNLSGLDNYKFSNLIFLSPDEVSKTILRENAGLAKVTASKKFPDQLILQVEKYDPAANFKNSEGYFILSIDGHLVAKSKKPVEALPTINYYQDLNYFLYNPGDRLTHDDILTTLFFLSKAKKVGLRVISVDINNFDMIVFNLDKTRIFFTTEKSKETAAYELETVVYRYKIMGKSFAELDLRFDKPVVRF